MEQTALLIVDMQTALVAGHPCREAELLGNLQTLLGAARSGGTEVIYVRHDGGAGDELEAGSDGWQICAQLAPAEGEKIFEKRYNSAFKDTPLRAYLDGHGIKTLVLVGMQTEYCIDATCKAAFEFGYTLVMPHRTTATFDNSFFKAETIVDYYEQMIWAGRFARIMPVADAAGRFLA